MNIQSRALRAALGMTLLLACVAPAAASVHTYQGQIQIQPASGPCAPVSGGTFNIFIYGRDDGAQRIEGYLSGDQIAHAHFSGNNLGQLALTYAGEGHPSHVLRLRQVGNGEYVGTTRRAGRRPSAWRWRWTWRSARPWSPTFAN